MPRDPAIDAWYAALEERHLADLRFAEVRRAIRALSQRYVHAPRAAGPPRALDGRGKRAAFALFFAPLHLITVKGIVERLGSGGRGALLDLGCGTGAAGAGWALGRPGPGALRGLDRNGWAVAETRWNWRALGLPGNAGRGDLMGDWPRGGVDRIVLGWTVNELDERSRSALLERLLERARRGAELLVVEPIARRVTPWWNAWAEAFGALGGRDDDWRFAGELPPRLREFDRAAGLDHRELTARSLWLNGARTAPRRPA